MEASAAARPRIDAHFDRIRANLIRCEECNENFFFDFLRHPRYFVTHFKTCHLKNVLYRFNGCSEEENQRVRFGPKRKKDATAWFGQLKSTEKRMISMQDNKWGEIAERECWSCRLCKQARKSSDMPHAFESDDVGQRQALLHIRQCHEAAYQEILRSFPAVNNGSVAQRAQVSSSAGCFENPSGNAAPKSDQSGANAVLPKKPSKDAERSRLRRMRATPEARKAEAERSRRRREQLTPAQRQADAERRARKKQREDERSRSRLRRAEASPEAKEREMKRSRERRQKATDLQRQREAQRSRTRRQNATEEQRLREKERCQRRYEAQKQEKMSRATSGGSTQLSPPSTSISDAMTPPATSTSETMTPATSTRDQTTPPTSTRVVPAELARRSLLLQQQQEVLKLQFKALHDLNNDHAQDTLL